MGRRDGTLGSRVQSRPQAQGAITAKIRASMLRGVFFNWDPLKVISVEKSIQIVTLFLTMQ